MRITTNVRKSALNHLIEGTDYCIVNTHPLETIKVAHPIPYETGYGKNAFPAYLREFYACYEYQRKRRCWGLKSEYRWNRPIYTIEITPVMYDIILTDYGKDCAQRRFNQYQRLAQQYDSLLK